MRAKVQTKEKSLDIFLPQREDYICMNLKASLLKFAKLGTLLGALPQLARRDGAGLAHFPFCWGLAPASLGLTAAPGPGQKPRSLWSDPHLGPAVSSVL